ncbi:MAG: elongation factor 1-beta [Candidatus Nanoarchaeia archaeon]
MGTAAVRMKIMPESPASDLKKIEKEVKTFIEKDGGRIMNFTQEPIAFGLKAIYASFEWPEEKELDDLEAKLNKVEEVKSAEVSDIRRAIG